MKLNEEQEVRLESAITFLSEAFKRYKNHPSPSLVENEGANLLAAIKQCNDQAVWLLYEALDERA